MNKRQRKKAEKKRLWFLGYDTITLRAPSQEIIDQLNAAAAKVYDGTYPDSIPMSASNFAAMMRFLPRTVDEAADFPFELVDKYRQKNSSKD